MKTFYLKISKQLKKFQNKDCVFSSNAFIFFYKNAFAFFITQKKSNNASSRVCINFIFSQWIIPKTVKVEYRTSTLSIAISFASSLISSTSRQFLKIFKLKF